MTFESRRGANVTGMDVQVDTLRDEMAQPRGLSSVEH